MNKALKITLLFLLIGITAIVVLCENESLKNSDYKIRPVTPVITINGRAMDTAYLFADYQDQGAEYILDRDGRTDCYDYKMVTEKSGTVNTRVCGTYFITYYAEDTLGNPIPPKTRTVEVVENKAAFLNGAYDVTF